MPTAVSAPGKVLLAGGYLVLDRKYTGLVFGLSARIHVLVVSKNSVKEDNNQIITVHSPQFIDAIWTYSYSITEGGDIQVSQVNDGASKSSSPNRFIEMSLIYGLSYIVALGDGNNKIAPIKITIIADTDYYSNASEPSQVYPRFPFFSVPLSSAHKTGLGSSAALVTALTSAILLHYIPSFELNESTNRTKIHNLAQAAHCAAQGKIGSGFDIAGAVFGACVYRRFSPGVLQDMGEPDKVVGFATRVINLVEKTNSWDVEIQKNGVTLPPGWALVMCDVDCGSSTVSMVKDVLRWRQKNSETADSIWGELQKLQEILVAQLQIADAQGIRKSLNEIRHLVRQMSAMSGVPIEPVEQTALIDAILSNIDDVIGGVVPGAGGYDAIVLLIKDNKETIGKLKTFLESWGAQNGGNFRLLSARGESEGVKREVYQNYTRCYAS